MTAARSTPTPTSGTTMGVLATGGFPQVAIEALICGDSVAAASPGSGGGFSPTMAATIIPSSPLSPFLLSLNPKASAASPQVLNPEQQNVPAGATYSSFSTGPIRGHRHKGHVMMLSDRIQSLGRLQSVLTKAEEHLSKLPADTSYSQFAYKTSGFKNGDWIRVGAIQLDMSWR